MVIYPIRALAFPDNITNIDTADFVLMRSDLDCGYKYLGKFYSPLIDSVADSLERRGMSAVLVSTPYSRYRREKFFRKPYLLNRKYFLISATHRLLQRMNLREAGDDRLFHQRVELWSQLFRNVGARAVLGVTPTVEVFAACSVIGIPCYDLQHGVIAIGEDPYYDALLEWIDGPQGSGILGGFLCWDAGTAQKLNQRCGHRQKPVAVVINHPWTARFIHPSPDDSVVKDAMARLPIPQRKPTILVTLQWALKDLYESSGLGMEGFNTVMPSALERLIRSSTDQFTWWIKIHPLAALTAEGKRHERYLEAAFGSVESVRWREVSDAPLPALLKSVAVHITDSSAVTSDAASFGVPTGLWNPMFKQESIIGSWFPDEHRMGMVSHLAWDESAIQGWLKKVLSAPTMAFRGGGTGNADVVDILVSS